MRAFGRLAALGLGAVCLAVVAIAATDAEWSAFRKDVEAKCLKAAEPLFAAADATVDPFGSQSYGLALVRGKAKGAETTEIAAICVYDKHNKTVEIGSELAAE